MPVVKSLVEEVKVFKVGTSLPQYKDLIGVEVPYWTHFFRIGDILFDTGHINVSEEVAEYIKDAKIVFLTHHHEDHVGNAHLLAEKGVDIYAHEKSLDFLSNPPSLKTYRRLVWGIPKPFRAKPIDTAPLDELGVEAIYTPGHTKYHLSYKIDKYIFVGDLIAGKKPPLIAFIEEDFIEIINSLKLVLTRKFDFAFSGMGVLTREEVEKYLNALVELRERARELRGKGLTINDIISKIIPNPPQIVLAMEIVSEGEWSRKNLVKSLLGLK